MAEEPVDAASATGRGVACEPLLSGRLTALLLVAVTALAVLLRFTDLATQPGGLYPDEAAEGVSANRMLQAPGYSPVFIPEDGGREALFAYIVSTVFRVAGSSVVSLRGTAALLGVLTVPAVYLLCRRFGRGPALAAAGWVAGSVWMVAISRDGMRNVLVPLFTALALLSLMNWADRPGRRSALLAGAICSLAALYTYQPLKLLPLLILGWMLWLRRRDRETFKALLGGLLPLTVAFVIVGAPMIAAAASDPQNYFGRSFAVTAINRDAAADSSFMVHELRTLGMFAFTGDPNPRHDVDALPALGIPLTAVALLGVVRLWRRRRDAAHALVLLSLPLFLVPPLVATEGGSPHFLRALGLATPLAVCIGLGAAVLWEGVRSAWGAAAARALAGGVAVLLAAIAAGGGHAYVTRSLAARYSAYSHDLVALATLARGGAGTVVILDDYSATVVRFLDAHDMPTIASPTAHLDRRTPHTAILALDRGDIRRVVDAATADRAQVAAVDGAGHPAVWIAQP